MEFRTYLVNTNKSSLSPISLAGFILLFLSVFFWAFEALNDIALFITFIGVLLSAIGFFTNRNVKPPGETGKILIRILDSGIEIKSRFYPFSEIKNQYFFYHSFYSQSPYGYYFENAGYIEFGTANRIQFKHGDTEVNELFCLTDMEHANLFFQTLNYLKGQRLHFEMEFRPFRRTGRDF
ncbi:hypothetical protein DC498_10415 [Terrimonas sp.]|uniref:hypothetical protein n=1 Tax=Terrimonas sp. TaxID=1914338 RepID=UPI000D51BEE2|nr:hypothetical protein [Terrimonas sp.]PVD52506.1 hypothetical protein DC498_10415 [Terrimonas sp.]